MVLTPEIEQQMIDKHIDKDLTLQFLAKYRNNRRNRQKKTRASDIPSIDGKTILDLTKGIEFIYPYRSAVENLQKTGVNLDPADYGRIRQDKIVLVKNANCPKAC